MSAQDHIDPLLDKAVNRAACPRHRDIEDTVVSRREVMVGNNDTDHVIRYRGKSLRAMSKLIEINSAIRDAAPWSGGIQAYQYDIADFEDRVEIGRDDFAVELVWLEEALENPPQRHVVVAGNHQHRKVRHAVEELPGFLELVTLGSLGQVAAHHDGVGIKRWDGLQQDFSNRRYEWRPEMQVRYVEDSGWHHYGTTSLKLLVHPMP